MAGALFFHFAFLGIEVQGDGGLLFAYAVTVFLASLVAVLDRKNDIPILKNLF
jgi:putative oxidoreductase